MRYRLSSDRLYGSANMSRIFPIVPASSKALWLIGSLALFVAILLLVTIYLGYSSCYTQFELSEEGLRIKGDLHGRKIPISSLVVDEARKIDLNNLPQYQPKWRTNGTAVPGYRAGWFKLRNGEKAFMFVTETTDVVYLPTREGYSVLDLQQKSE
ncbi:hypothetical protein Ple7327_4033 [Pleurocapsa sp. PCC 7327]|nr:hypothetical protein Ple7327_4033 [Pleurocapsa sp. PCC 7327]